MGHHAINVQDVSHRYEEHLALCDVSFSVAEGALFGLLGPNGGGKTTLFRILSTLMPPSQGTARVHGIDTTAQPAQVRRRLGIVFQQPALDDELTVLENLRFHGALYGLSSGDLSNRLTELLDLFGLADRAGDRVHTLSGGLQRRADLIRGLLHAPPVLLLDEPTVGLDPAARRAFWQALNRLRRREKTTMMVATHLMEEAEDCDKVGIIDKGRLVAHGTPHALKDELGGETLWLETDIPHALADRIQAQFGVEVGVIGDRLQISHPEAPSLLSSLYEAFEQDLDSATVRKPTLEDVFLIRTGAALQKPGAPLPSPKSASV